MAKPRNKKQKYFMELRERIPKYTEKHKSHAESMHEFYVGLAYTKNHACTKCGHKWKANNSHTRILKGCDCPSCGTKLKHRHDKFPRTDHRYYGEITTIDNYQLIRIFMSRSRHHKGRKAEFSFAEVMNHFIDEKGNVTTIEASTTQQMGGWSAYDNWVMDGELEFRSVGRNTEARQTTYPEKYYPKVKVLPILKRNGFKYSTHDLCAKDLMSKLLTDNWIETLFKAKQYEVVHSLMQWRSPLLGKKHALKIALRHNYIIKEVSDWSDYVDLLTFFGKDTRNPHYVCPDNLHQAHNKYVAKKQAYDESIKIADAKERLRVQAMNKTELAEYKKQKALEKASEFEKAYERHIKRFKDLVFKGDKITIQPLKSVGEFYVCGKKLHHCLFAERYYNDRTRLLLKAEVNGKLIETVEVSLTEYKIMQSRGLQNKATEYNKEIVEIVEDNMKAIMKIAS